MPTIEDLRREIELAVTREGYHRAKVLVDITEDLYGKMLDQGLTLASLAKRIGTKKRKLRRFFCGEDDMKVRDVVKAAFALGLVVDIAFRSKDEDKT